jgi:hypothetical protein
MKPTASADPRVSTGKTMWAKDPNYDPVPGYKRTRAYREANPAAREREKRRNAARQRALVRLSRIYPDDFKDLFDEELEIAYLAAHSDGCPDG